MSAHSPSERLIRPGDLESGLINLAGAPPSWARSFTWRISQRRSIWRLWKRLSRLQRSLVIVLTLTALLLLLARTCTWSVAESVELPSEQETKEAPSPVLTASYQLPSIEERRKAVVVAFQHAWKGYTTYAWGHDHLKPISRSAHNWFGLGLTMVDALDTMYLMGLEKELAAARDWVATSMDMAQRRDVNLFETTIRVLGGLLSMHTLTNDQLYLDKATELGRRLLPGFRQSPSGIPYSDVNLATGKAHAPSWAPDSTVSEVSSLQLEFRTLSRATGDPEYEKRAFAVSKRLHELPKVNGLVPMFINAETGLFNKGSTLTMGARADSYYEYLLKQWLQTGKTHDWLKEDYLAAVSGIRSRLVQHSIPTKLLFLGEVLRGGTFSPKMDHLVCYFPGTLALGHKVGGMPQDHMDLAVELMDTCLRMYSVNPTFLSPEIAYFNLQPGGSRDIIIKANDGHNLLRPETIESLWYMYYFTKNETYRDWGWRIFQGFERHCKIEGGGYSSIDNVQNPKGVKHRDMMESFFLGETLKYLFLLFADDDIMERYSPTKFVYNTEAHLLPLYDS